MFDPTIGGPRIINLVAYNIKDDPWCPLCPSSLIHILPEAYNNRIHYDDRTRFCNNVHYIEHNNGISIVDPPGY